MKISLSFLGIFLSVATGDGNSTKLCELMQSHCEPEQYNNKSKCYSLWLNLLCLRSFEESMGNVSNIQWCEWNQVRSYYDKFAQCTENCADCLRVPWPNQVVEETFLTTHAKYFQACPVMVLADPPPSVILALIMTPICLIPVMVVMVVLKTKSGDGTS